MYHIYTTLKIKGEKKVTKLIPVNGKNYLLQPAPAPGYCTGCIGQANEKLCIALQEKTPCDVRENHLEAHYIFTLFGKPQNPSRFIKYRRKRILKNKGQRFFWEYDEVSSNK